MSTKSPPEDSETLWYKYGRLLLLLIIMSVCAGSFYWYRYIQPLRMFKQAKLVVRQDPDGAEKLVAAAISQSSANLPEAEFFRVVLLGRLGKWDEALGQFSLIKYPEKLPAKKLCVFAREAQSQGFYYLAERVFKAAKHDSTFYMKIQRSLIQIHLQVRNEDLAKVECQELLEKAPNDVTAWQVFGTISMNQKDLSDAEMAFRKCLELSNAPQQIQSVREDLIQVLIDKGNLKFARQEIELLRKNNAVLSDRALIEEAWILRMEGKPLEGVKVIEPLLKKKSKMATQAFLLRGFLYSDAGQKKEAVINLQKVIAVQPWNKEAHHKLSVVYTQMEEVEKATRHRVIADQLTDQALELMNLKEMLSKTPDDSALRKRVAELYENLGQLEMAKKLLGEN